MVGGQGGILPNKVLRGKDEVFWGTPARPLREYLKQLAALASWARGKCGFRHGVVRLALQEARELRSEDGSRFSHMALIVIGGHSRSVGKTSVVAGLIAALR